MPRTPVISTRATTATAAAAGAVQTRLSRRERRSTATLSRPAPAGSASPCTRCRHPWKSSTQQTDAEQGYRTTTETAQGAVGVLVRRLRWRAGDLFHARLQRQRDQYPLQWNLDRPGRHHFAHHGYGQSRPGRVPEGPSSIMSGLDAIGGSVNYVSRQPTTGSDQERIRCVDRFVWHLPYAFRLRRQHRGARARLSLRCQLSRS